MKVLKIGLAVVTLLILDAPVVSAQMVVSPNVGERVDYPFFQTTGGACSFGTGTSAIIKPGAMSLATIGAS